MRNALSIAPLLTLSRLRSRRGDAWLDILAVASFALSSLMALTVTGGIWMFTQWRAHPSELMVGAAADQWGGPTSADDMLMTYVILAFLAGTLLVFPIFSLGTSAARLGARGRSQRLASLRLIGVTGKQTIAMSLVETLVQWLLGALLGVIAYFATLPLWRYVSFLGSHIDPADMVLPLRILALILCILLFLALASTVAGLQRVRISPLGVAHRETSPALRFWRPVAFMVGLVVFFAWSGVAPASNDSTVYIVTSVLLLGVIGGVTLVGPWVLQLLAMPLAHTRRVPRLLAMRRILDDPRAAWRNVSAIALLCFIAGFVAIMPDTGMGSVTYFEKDIMTGIEITLAFGFAVAALSTLMNQSSTIFDRAPETYALSQVGFPRSVFSKTRLHQVLGPLLFASVGSSALGALLAIAASTMVISASGFIRMGVILALGVGLSTLSLLLCEPLERHVLATRKRTND